MAALHDSPVGSHSGPQPPFTRSSNYSIGQPWRATSSSMGGLIRWVLRPKPDWALYPGLLPHLPVSQASWEIISMDFIEGLPPSGSSNTITVIIDRYSRFAHFVPLHHPFTTASVAQLFFDCIYRLYVLLVSIISDRDCVFTRNFGNYYSNWLASVCGSARRITRRQVSKPSMSTNVWRPSSGALFTHACIGGLLGSPLLSSGIILLFTSPWVAPHLRFSMAFWCTIWASTLFQFPWCQNYHIRGEAWPDAPSDPPASAPCLGTYGTSSWQAPLETLLLCGLFSFPQATALCAIFSGQECRP